MTKAKSPKYVVYFRRQIAGKTNYAKRLALVKSRKTRMVIRKSNKSIVVQFVNFDFEGDKTLVTVHSKKLIKLFNWPSRRNVYTAYLTGLYAAKEAKKKNVSEFVLDLGLNPSTKGSVLYAALKGAVDAGLKTAYDDSMIPNDKLASPPDKIKDAFMQAKKKIAG